MIKKRIHRHVKKHVTKTAWLNMVRYHKSKVTRIRMIEEMEILIWHQNDLTIIKEQEDMEAEIITAI